MVREVKCRAQEPIVDSAGGIGCNGVTTIITRCQEPGCSRETRGHSRCPEHGGPKLFKQNEFKFLSEEPPRRGKRKR